MEKGQGQTKRDFLALMILAVTIGLFLTYSVLLKSGSHSATPSTSIVPSSIGATSSVGTTSSISTTTIIASNSLFQSFNYCTVNGTQLKMIIHYPPGFSPPFPIVIYVHGGGWMSNASQTPYAPPPNLTTAGIAYGAISYRGLPNYKFPTQVEDVKCAIRFLRANAKPLRINPSRIGAYGGSAGGHLVDLLGLVGNNAGWDVGQYINESSSVEAVAEISGPTNLTAKNFGQAGLTAISNNFGSSLETLTLDSPISYAKTPHVPPFLLEYGLNDTLVPPDQGTEFYNALKSAGNNATLILVKNAGHGLQPTGTGTETPSLNQTRQDILNFFAQALKK